MNKYRVTVTILATSQEAVYLVNAANATDAETNFAANYPGLINAALYSHVIALQASGDVGLENVSNTSDANKPVSTATQTALDAKEATANKGAANGYAPLGADSKVPLANLPTLGVGDVVGPLSAGGDKVVLFDGITGKLIKDSGLTLSGTNTGDQTLPTDATLEFTDVTTNNSSTTKHGFLRKLDGLTTTYMRGDGTWASVVATPPNIASSLLAPTGDETIAAGYGAYIPDQYEVPSTFTTEIGSGAILEIG